MRIHANHINAQPANFYGAGNLRAENAERAAKTRRRLRRTAQSLDATALEAANPGAGLLVGEWLSVRHNYALAEDEYTPGEPD